MLGMPYYLNNSQVWGGTHEESMEKVHSFFKTNYFKTIAVVPGALEGLASLKAKGYNLVVVTSRQTVIERETRDWLHHNFPEGTFSGVEFGNHWGRDGAKRSKGDICRQIGASAIIDDSLTYTSEVSSVGIQALLFDLDGSYPWNKIHSLPSAVTRVTSWEMAVEKIGQLF